MWFTYSTSSMSCSMIWFVHIFHYISNVSFPYAPWVDNFSCNLNLIGYKQNNAVECCNCKPGNKSEEDFLPWYKRVLYGNMTDACSGTSPGRQCPRNLQHKTKPGDNNIEWVNYRTSLPYSVLYNQYFFYRREAETYQPQQTCLLQKSSTCRESEHM